MSNFYFYPNNNYYGGDLSDPNNWYQDDYQNASWGGSLPSLSDNVYINGFVSSDSMSLGAVGFSTVTLEENGAISPNVTINTSSFSNGSYYNYENSGYAYQNGLVDTSYTGIISNVYGQVFFFYNGSYGTGSYNGEYFLGGMDDGSIYSQGPILYFNYDYNGYDLNGTSYNGSFSGVYNGELYGNGTDHGPVTGVYYDYAYGEWIYQGSAFTGVYDGYAYDSGTYLGNATGFNYDVGFGGYVLNASGVLFNGGYNGTHYTNGQADAFTGFDYDYGYSSPSGFINGLVDTTDIYSGSTPIPVNYPDPSDVRNGVTYGLSLFPQTGTYVATGGTSSGFNLGQLIGLPSFIQL